MSSVYFVVYGILFSQKKRAPKKAGRLQQNKTETRINHWSLKEDG